MEDFTVHVVWNCFGFIEYYDSDFFHWNSQNNHVKLLSLKDYSMFVWNMKLQFV